MARSNHFFSAWIQWLYVISMQFLSIINTEQIRYKRGTIKRDGKLKDLYVENMGTNKRNHDRRVREITIN